MTLCNYTVKKEIYFSPQFRGMEFEVQLIPWVSYIQINSQNRLSSWIYRSSKYVSLSCFHMPVLGIYKNMNKISDLRWRGGGGERERGEIWPLSPHSHAGQLIKSKRKKKPALGQRKPKGNVLVLFFRVYTRSLSVSRSWRNEKQHNVRHKKWKSWNGITILGTSGPRYRSV